MASAVGTRLSRDDFRKAKELEELRKTGAAPPELDPEGRIINPHIPQYMSTAPWYYNSTAPSLKHQYLSKYKPQAPAPSIHAPNKTVVSVPRAEFVKGACDNCGSQTHRAKDCLERPRKRAARYGGEVVGKDEWVQQEELDYDGKRDRWKGYDGAEYSKVVERYEKAELERKKQRLKELEAAYQLDQQQRESKEEEKADAERKDGEAPPADATAASATSDEAAKAEGEGAEAAKAAAPSSDVKESDLDKLKRIKAEKRLHKLRKKLARAAAQSSSSSDAPAPPPSSSSDSDDSGDSGDEAALGTSNSEYRDYGEVITKMDAKARITVRNLRIREDTAKYLRNLDLSSAHYDPKTRSMRQTPYPGKRPDEVLYAGDNFVRQSGDVRDIAQLRKYVWDHAERVEAMGASAASPDAPAGQAEVVEIHAVALPSAAEKLYQAHKAAASEAKAATKQRILEAYGGGEHLSRPAQALLQVTEAYVEYDDSGRVLRGAERAQARSKYAEDVWEDGHRAVWGSWWDRKEGKWGYACCQQTLRHCICVGEVGKTMKEEMQRERVKRESRQDVADVMGDKRKREGDEEEKKAPASASSAPAAYSRYARPPSELELNDFHRGQRRLDDPMNSAAFKEAV